MSAPSFMKGNMQCIAFFKSSVLTITRACR